LSDDGKTVGGARLVARSYDSAGKSRSTRNTDLGREEALAPPTLGQRLAYDLLRAAEAVGRRRLDQGDAAIDSRTNGADRLCFIGSAPHSSPDRPCAERDARRLERCAGNVEAPG
jgi:hypothetical protein